MIIDVTISTLIKHHSRQQVEKYNFGAYAQYRAGTKRNQYVGLVAESVICDIVGKSLPDGKRGYDQGIDFINTNGRTFDVKSMERQYRIQPHYCHNYYLRQFKHATDYFIFTNVLLAENIVQICGYAAKKNLPRIGERNPPGSKLPRDDGRVFIPKDWMINIRQNRLSQFTDQGYLLEEIERL